MPQTTIDRLIVNNPYEEPQYYWKYDPPTRLFDLAEGRRPAGYVVASERSKAYDDPGIFVEIPLVNQIRPRIKAWRENGYQGVTGITKRLLTYWYDPEEFESRRFFFCQLEAIETLIWLTEAPSSERTGLEIPDDGGLFQRICSKMATGSGKTVVMAMLIAWQILNKITSPQDRRFSKYVLVMAPGLTVKNRLSVLETSSEDNYYEKFRIVPAALYDKLRQGKVQIRNWHALAWDSEEQIQKRRSVDKRGAKSDEAYVRETLGEMSNARNILVINDEAHHAWRLNTTAEGKYLRSRDMKDSAEEATVWIGGLDRIHRTRNILCCYDFSATPFTPSGKKNSDESLFGWIVSDFGLNDAIESGLVKTPRVVIRDDAHPDAKTYKSRLYHIYNDEEVKTDLNRSAKPEEPLPDLVVNAYYLLGYDWRETLRAWKESGQTVPPVMITVCNRTETAARVKHAFDYRKVHINELCETQRILHIDSKVLAMAESQDVITIGAEDFADNEEQADDVIATPKYSKKVQAELLRKQVDTVGQLDKNGKSLPGTYIQNVISVGMLSEGWDAKTVTHIMGLRAFSSQLLCEQVVGRGLRRTTYDVDPVTGLFEPEYVNIFGVPFTFLPHEGGEGGPPPPPKPKTMIIPIDDKSEFCLSWPNIVRIDRVYQPGLSLDWDRVNQLELDSYAIRQIAALAPIVDGKPDVTKITEIDLEHLASEFRTQRIVFEAARDNYHLMGSNWKGNKEYLLAQLVRLVEEFIASDCIVVDPPIFNLDDLRRRLVITLNMSKVIQHISDAIRYSNTERLEPIFDRDHPVLSTSDMPVWYTSKPCEYTAKSHINYVVLDSTWESSEAFHLDHNPEIDAWVKNDHLNFEILYIYKGVVKKYRPDFIIRKKSGEMCILETKGQETEQDRVKKRYLQEWIDAVNQHGGFGKWGIMQSQYLRV
ncbi:MAG: DEAD/DEAH box helicase family protein [Candidatus Cloacimonadaceae bacterium]|nr:DEAD/DEAH box helicase family protein [Candidatus Cloacimonadaceae bacterium]